MKESERLCVVCAVLYRRFRYFCVRRGDAKYPYTAHKWEFPGGKVEKGEFGHQAIIREMKEELNLDVKVDGHLCTVEHDYPDFTIQLEAFLCEPSRKNDFAYELNEHEEACWASLRELRKMDFAEADRKIIHKLSVMRFWNIVSFLSILCLPIFIAVSLV